MDASLTKTLKVLAITLLSVVLVVIAVYFLERIHTVTTVVVGAIFLCYIIYPAVRRLNARLPLWASISIVYVVALAILAGALAFAVPAATDNIRQFAHDAPALVSSAQGALADPNNPIVSHLPPQVKHYLEQIPAEIVTYIDRYGGEAATNLLRVVVSAVAILALFVIIPVVAIYMMMDMQTLHDGLVKRIPLAKRRKTLKILSEIDGVVGGFVRGQLLVAAIVGVLIIIMLSILHVRYATVIGIVAGFLEIIPYAGAVAGAIPAVVIASITNGPLNALFVVIGFIVINQLEGHVISPVIVSGRVGLSPLVVILALLTGGELFGLPGLLIAVPIAGIIKVLFTNLVPEQDY